MIASLPDLGLVLCISVVALISGALQSLAGFGFSLLAVPALTWILPPTVIAPLLVLLCVPLNAVVAWRGRRHIDLQGSWPLFLTGAIFTVPGALLLVVAAPSVLKVLIGIATVGAAAVLASGLRLRLGRPFAWLASAGAISGLLNGSVTYGGPPVILLYTAQGLPKQEFRSRLTAYFLWLNIVTIPIYAAAGLLSGEVIVLALLALLPLLIGVFIGIRAAQVIPEGVFRKVVLVAIVGLGVAAVGSGLSACGQLSPRQPSPASPPPESPVVAEAPALAETPPLASVEAMTSSAELLPGRSMEVEAELCSFAWWEAPRPCETLAGRIAPPAGYERVPLTEGSFGAFLRRLPLLPEGASVHLFDGSLKLNQTAQAAVVDIDVGKRDLQQCADAVMRLRAEYLWATGKSREICFRAASGANLAWSHAGRKGFRKYLDQVFGKANTASLLGQLSVVERPAEVEVGDVFIVPASGGMYGHAVLVVDLAVGPAGDKVLLLVQSYMPAQEIHLLRNPRPGGMSPWYPVPEAELVTPEWTFPAGSLRRFVRTGCAR